MTCFWTTDALSKSISSLPYYAFLLLVNNCLVMANFQFKNIYFISFTSNKFLKLYPNAFNNWLAFFFINLVEVSCFFRQLFPSCQSSSSEICTYYDVNDCLLMANFQHKLMYFVNFTSYSDFKLNLDTSNN